MKKDATERIVIDGMVTVSAAELMRDDDEARRWYENLKAERDALYATFRSAEAWVARGRLPYSRPGSFRRQLIDAVTTAQQFYARQLRDAGIEVPDVV